MSIYVVGDIQGNYNEFRRLLDLIDFNSSDTLWLVGDIVNRGPDSLLLLRFLKAMSDAVVAVLGNHDLHLLMVAEGYAKTLPGDTLQNILTATDRDELLYWLRHRKLLHVSGDYVMVHAGLLPSWSVMLAEQLANEVESLLQDKNKKNYQKFCSHMYGNQPNQWRKNIKGYDRIRVIINAMTRMRICTPNGKMDFTYKGRINNIPAGYLPWFDVPGRVSEEVTVICGHWSALSLVVRSNLIALDTGCMWGGSLTAIRLEDKRIYQVPCVAAAEGIMH